MRLFLLAAALALFGTTALAQHDHAAGHNEYRNWASQKTGNCCNNMDCRGLADDEWRQGEAGTEILIDGTWCPVLPIHLTLPGARSPDWSIAHACIRPLPSALTTCERLLCFMEAVKS